MESDESKVYRALQRHLDSMPIGFPPTQSGVEIRILKRLFTPEEARIATYLTYSATPSETLEDVYQRVKTTGLSKEQLEQILDTMVSKGLVQFKQDQGKKYYNSAPWVIGIFEFQINKLTKELLVDVHQYNREAYREELFSTHIPPQRVIPVGKSITPEHNVASYDDIRKMINSMDGPFMVMNCVCRQAREVAGDPCKTTDRHETCLSFGEYVGMYLEQGWGREITKDELLEIIDKNENDGLVLQPSNSKELDFLCSCCGCCCGFLRGAKVASKPVELLATNYYSEVNQDLCTGCGTCMERCQMDAITLENDVSQINLDRCIGCGVCVANCPSNAIKLQKREEEQVPPRTIDEMFSIILENKTKREV